MADQPTQISVAFPHVVTPPDNIVSSLLGLLATIIGAPVGSLPAPPVTAPPNPVVPTPTGSDELIGWDAADAGMCLSWVQDQLRLAHVGATALAAWTIYASARAMAPAPGFLVFFSAGASNAGFGHVGIVQPNTSVFRSIWNSGAIMDTPIAKFASDNGVSVLGYVDPSLIGSTPVQVHPI